MPLPIDALAKQLNPHKTCLLFGAGASLPSGAPSVSDILDALSEVLGLTHEDYSFAEFCSLFELRRSRRELISIVREKLKNLRPTGGILNLPDYSWPAIHTTNYDDLIEKVYLKKNKEIKVFTSNFDFDGQSRPDQTPIFKLHGTIGFDIVDGHNSRMVLTTEDNDAVEEYRQKLFDRLKGDLLENDLIIIGYSLSDNDLKSMVKRALELKRESHSTQNIHLLIYKKDENRALLFENQGLRVAFGGVDEFFLELAKASPSESIAYDGTDFLSRYAALTPTTFDIKVEANRPTTNFDAMYSGSPAGYPEIRTGLTFARTASQNLMQTLSEDKQFLTILGASGVGKTTMSRQIALMLTDGGCHGWEHHRDRPFIADEWRKLANDLKSNDSHGVLLLDDAHSYLPEVNRLVDLLSADENKNLKLILTSAKNHWKPRVKSSNLTTYGRIHNLSQLDNTEVQNLLNLVKNKPNIARLVDQRFRGFTEQEKRRRLTERCNRDFFVCLKNIFANERFDLVILREFSAVTGDFQTFYKHLCALESLGVVVHRQLMIRLLNIPAQDLSMILDNLDGLVEEYTIDRRQSVYGWRGRHIVISQIIAEYKFADSNEIYSLLQRVIRNLSPTYDVEMVTLRQLCSFNSGIRQIPDIGDQNELLRMMISTAPGERVPRHRLISNLIRQGAFSDAETEIRVFENDLRADGPIRRYKVRLTLERAIAAGGIAPEDQAKLLNDAHAAACDLLERTPNLPHTLRLFADVCLEVFKATGDHDYVDSVRAAMKQAESETDDPEITQALAAFESRLTRSSTLSYDLATVPVEDFEDIVDTE